MQWHCSNSQQRLHCSPVHSFENQGPQCYSDWRSGSPFVLVQIAVDQTTTTAGTTAGGTCTQRGFHSSQTVGPCTSGRSKSLLRGKRGLRLSLFSSRITQRLTQMIEERKKEGKQGEENLRRTGSRADTDTDRQTDRQGES